MLYFIAIKNVIIEAGTVSSATIHFAGLKYKISIGGEKMPEKLGVSNDRISSIDVYRGIAIVLMILGNFASGVRWVPAFLKHAKDIGYTVADVVAPMFLLSIAATVELSMRKRQKLYGTKKALGQLAVRSLGLVGIGAIITAGDAITPSPDMILSWGVLQCIGTACLLLVPLVFCPHWVRILVGVSLFVIYQALLDSFYLDVVLRSVHNGLIGVLSWAGFLMVATGLFDVFHALKKSGHQLLLLLLCGGTAIGISLSLSTVFPISKNRASLTYMLLSLGLCLLLFAVCHLILSTRPNWLKALQRIGRNPLALYISHLFLLALVIAPGIDAWYAGAPVWLTLIQAAVILVAVISLSYWYDRKGFILKLA
jgi:predicted acyltransferase